MKILVIKPSSLGDVIHALPFLGAVKEAFPSSMIDWVISKNLSGILEGNPLIHELLIFNKDAWTNFRNLPETLSEISSLRNILRSRHYDMVVDLQGLLRSAVIAFFTPAATKIGFADAREGGRFFYDRKVKVNRTLHAVDKCLKLASVIGAETKRVDFPLHISDEAKSGAGMLLGDIGEYIVMAPSARWLTKRWPAERFALLMKEVSIPSVIIGSKADRNISREIAGNLPDKGLNMIDLCGKTGLQELSALIAGAKAVLSNDSGPMQIAAALGIPTVAIFGPTDPAKTGPYGWQTNGKLKVLKANVPCSPCRKKRCSEFICMNRLKMETVFNALKEFL